MYKILIVLVVLALSGGAYWYTTQMPAPITEENIAGDFGSLTSQTQMNNRANPAVTPQNTNTKPAPVPVVLTQAYVSPNGYSIQIPVSAQVSVHPLVGDTTPTMTVIKSSYGTLCISVRVGCDGRGMQGWEYEEKILASADGNLRLQIYSKADSNRAIIVATPMFSAQGWGDGNMNFETTISERTNAEQILASIDFK
jgi:hypothetical protein